MSDFWKTEACNKGSKYIAGIDDDTICTSDEFNSLMWAMDYHDSYAGGKVYHLETTTSRGAPGYLKIFKRETMCQRLECLSMMTMGNEDKQTSMCLKDIPGTKWMSGAELLGHKRRVTSSSYICIRCDMVHDVGGITTYVTSNENSNSAKNSMGGSWKHASGHTADDALTVGGKWQLCAAE
jgi:hypothetical protein